VSAENPTVEHPAKVRWERGRTARLRSSIAQLLGDPRAPVTALCLILGFSFGVKVIDLGQPCTAPCHRSDPHTLIFDEAYYVNAARVIDGIEPPKKQPYHGAPKGMDPNAEHPQLAKLIMAGTIKLFGDDALGWRIGSVLFGLIAMVALYALVLAAGGSGWLAVGTVAVMAMDNLLLVHSRIGTLDIYALAMMLTAAALYMRGSPLLAGLALGIGGCMKEVALYLLFVIVLYEALRLLHARWGRRLEPGERRPKLALGGVRDAAVFIAVSAASFLALLWLLDVLMPAWDPGTHTIYGGSPFTHLAHIYKFALLLKAKAGGIASTPWQWLLDQRPINYARVAVNTMVNGKIVSSHASVFFEGAINPFIIYLAIPALFAALACAWSDGERLAALGACWCLGTFLALLYNSEIQDRISYLYYMVLVMPGVYILTARLFASRRMPTAATVGWAVALVYGFLHLFPLRTLV
jgi:dolichyl-phosphate-mannose-protein mannosyltransferase